jgi:hypothetical protein
LAAALSTFLIANCPKDMPGQLVESFDMVIRLEIGGTIGQLNA